MATAQSLIQTALELLGVYAPGQTMSAADSARGLQVLNAMFDSWSNESLTCYAILEQSFSLVPGQTQYTIGPGGQINAPRPLKLMDSVGSAYLQDQLGNNYAMSVIARDRWNQIGSRNINSNMPDTLFYDAQYPLGIINIFPIPLLPYTVFFDAYMQLTDFANLTSAMTLPPGYEAAIYSNLAIWLKPFFTQQPLDPVVAEMASRTLAAIKRTNIRPAIAVFETEIVSRGASSYNPYSDRSGTA